MEEITTRPITLVFADVSDSINDTSFLSVIFDILSSNIGDGEEENE